LRIHNRKAKCYIPELLVELNSLFKQRDTIRNGNIMRTPHIPRPQKICSVCNYRIDKGYHICKPNPFVIKNKRRLVSLLDSSKDFTKLEDQGRVIRYDWVEPLLRDQFQKNNDKEN
jgi:hypothetical protein